MEGCSESAKEIVFERKQSPGIRVCRFEPYPFRSVYMPVNTFLTLSGYDDKEGFLQNQPYDFFARDHIPGVKLTQELFDAFREKTISYRENIKNVLVKQGEKSFFDYTKQYVQENRNKIIKIRRGECIASIQRMVKRTLGSAIADATARQLKDNSTVATIHHYAPIGHPYVLNPTLQMALPYFGNGTNPGLQKLVVLACANVSFNNFEFPPGHLLHAVDKDEILLYQMRFFGHTADAKPVLNHPAYGVDAITEIKSKLIALGREGKIGSVATTELFNLFEDVYASPHVLSCDTYVDQLTISNYWFFKKMFRNYKKFVPDLIFLSQEMVVLDLIKRHHLYEDTSLHKILFSPDAENLMYKYVEGLEGMFDRKKKYGTYLFWARPKTGKYREQLWKDGKYLVTENGSFKLELTRAAVAAAIENNELIPSVFLVYVVLGLYYGMILGGGPAQTMILPKVRNAYVNMMKEFGDSQSIEACEDLITDWMLISRPSLAYAETSNEIRIPATGLDVYAYGKNGDTIQQVIDGAKNVTLQEIINRALPSYYYEFVSAKDKNEDFAKITPHDIEALTGLSKKIPPMASI